MDFFRDSTGVSVKRISKPAAEFHSAWYTDKQNSKTSHRRTQDQRSSSIVYAAEAACLEVWK